MKRALPSLLATGLVAGMIGCQPAPAPPAVSGNPATTTSNTTNAVSSDVTLVSLSVPNMT